MIFHKDKETTFKKNNRYQHCLEITKWYQVYRDWRDKTNKLSGNALKKIIDLALQHKDIFFKKKLAPEIMRFENQNVQINNSHLK